MRLTIGVLEIDREGCAAWVKGESLPLTRGERKILHALACEPERLFSLDEIADEVGLTHRTVGAFLPSLRRKLRAAGMEGAVRNVHAMGWSLTTPTHQTA